MKRNKLFGPPVSILAKPSHEGGSSQSSGAQGRKLHGRDQDRLAPPSQVAKGRIKKTAGYKAPESL